MTVPVFRFAPSPNGRLHLGHAYSALLNYRAAKVTGGRFLLRIEDIDIARCTPELIQEMKEDLAWLGLDWETPELRQSDDFPLYRDALRKLEDLGLTYRAYLTRAEIKRFVEEQEAQGNSWPRDPDGAPLYPGDANVLSKEEQAARVASDALFAIRLDMKRALEKVAGPISWLECSAEVPISGNHLDAWFEGERISADPAAWGDVILARKDTPTSYHLSVVVDDARQGISDIIRGRDLYYATAVQRLLQILLDLPEPRYRHHRLILDEKGAKLSKSDKSTSLRDLRQTGYMPSKIFTMIDITGSS